MKNIFDEERATQKAIKDADAPTFWLYKIASLAVWLIVVPFLLLIVGVVFYILFKP